jgi:hypothetical protein
MLIGNFHLKRQGVSKICGVFQEVDFCKLQETEIIKTALAAR